ncbi:hypothetical protein MAR_035817 [Mya arenaria]|uniref:Uncharacterized protein n=1 Tax=Mya arenaria TaxID=6604 RepID=A0ABY7EPK6_MYAAR|nr:hypothetical protein MAR_035817 [Mya arenaria]
MEDGKLQKRIEKGICGSRILTFLLMIDRWVVTKTEWYTDNKQIQIEEPRRDQLFLTGCVPQLSGIDKNKRLIRAEPDLKVTMGALLRHVIIVCPTSTTSKDGEVLKTHRRGVTIPDNVSPESQVCQYAFFHPELLIRKSYETFPVIKSSGVVRIANTCGWSTLKH